MKNINTIEELKSLLEMGDEDASDLLWQLARADARKAWDCVDKTDIEDYLEDSGLDGKIGASDVIDYMKDMYELIDVDAEIRNAIESMGED